LELNTAVGPTEVPAPPAPTRKKAKSKAKGPHKRQISEAVPRAKRELARVPQKVAKAVTTASARVRAHASQNHVISNI